MLDLVSMITAQQRKREMPLLAEIFGSSKPSLVASTVDAFCTNELGSRIIETYFFALGQSAVFGLRLCEGPCVVVKAHSSRHNIEFLYALTQVQHYLADQGFPCPRPILEMRALAQGFATVEELKNEGEYRNPHDPVVRRSLAELLARQIALTQHPEAIPGIQPKLFDRRLSPEVLWPVSHDAIFNFEATAAGAEWIDALARPAHQAVLQGAGQLVLGHTDWSVKHVRYVGEQVSAVYDWESLALEKEPAIVGAASAYFTYNEWPGMTPHLPSQDEALAFVSEYEAARGKPFSPEEYQTLAAAATYQLAYAARCEHSLQPEERDYPDDSCRAILTHYGDSFLKKQQAEAVK
ncbi:MAG TPA: hypothetical protein VH593_21500 [Ktedonobacteraceae bacterium]